MIKKLDKNGRCCGRQPLIYRKSSPHSFCFRCDRAYDLETGIQIANWAYDKDGKKINLKDNLSV